MVEVVNPNIVHEERATADPTAMFNLISARWSELITWFSSNGGSAQLPELVPFISRWQDFEKKWDDNSTIIGSTIWEPIGELDAASDNISKAESVAIRRGYVAPRLNVDTDGTVRRDTSEVGKPTGASSPVASPTATGPIVVVPKTQAPVPSAFQKAVAVVADAASNDPAKDRPKDPNFAPKALAVGALGLGTVAAVVSMKSDGARAGVAVVGTLATVAAGWFAFGPKEKGGA
jgi:hypothetical protein